MASIPMDTDIPPPVQQSQVQVKFVTRHPDIAVPTAPILVPSNLKRYGLSQIINHLLDTTSPIPFDFLTGGAFLRTSLDAHLQSNGLSAESVITLEYVRAVVPPKFQAAFQHDDWVSSVSTAAALDGDNTLARILSGSYDGIARVWNLSGQVLAEAPGHSSAIKSVKWLDDGAQFVTSSMDRTLRLWSYSDDAIAPVAELLGHKATVENIAVHSASRRILSASTDSTVGLWSTQSSDSPAAPTDVLPPKPKKRKTASSAAVAAATAPRYGPLGLLSGHSSPVSAVMFDPKDSTVAYSVSWDHTIRTWDLQTQALVDTRTTQHPVLSVCALPGLSLLACGSSARHITLHDPRASASTVATSTLRGHTNAVVALCADGRSEWQMVSAGHDGAIRVWDVRAAGSGSMFTIKREGGEGVTGREKVFDVEWSRIGIVSGGEDKRVQINETPQAGEERAVVGKL